MTKKLFTGEKQNLPQLAEDVAAWLRQQGFEVQTGTSPNAYLVQARKQSTWRAMLGNNQSIDVKIEGTPDDYSIELDAGQWVKNLKESGPSAVVAAFATALTYGITAAWSASERSQIESRLWALKDAACPSCRKFGAARHTGQRCVRVENVVRLPGGDHQGVKVFTETYQCQFCPHAWQRGEQPRTVLLCPKCHEEDVKEATGEYVFSTRKSDRKSQDGQPLAEQVFTNTFRCRACGHRWNDGQQSRSFEACPECLKPGTRQPLGQAVTALRKTERRRNDGLSLAEQVFTNHFRCGECGCRWNDGEKARLVGVCPKCEKVTAAPKELAGQVEVCRCGGAAQVRRENLEAAYGKPISNAELQLIDAFDCICYRPLVASMDDETKGHWKEQGLQLPEDEVLKAYEPGGRWSGARVTDQGEPYIAVQQAGLVFGTRHFFWKTAKGAVPEGVIPYAEIDLKVLGCRQGTFGHDLTLKDDLVVSVHALGVCAAGLMASIVTFLRVAAQLAKEPVEGDWKECFTLPTACPNCKTATQVTGQSIYSAFCSNCSTTFTPSFMQVAWGSVVADGLRGAAKGVGTVTLGVAAFVKALGESITCRHCGERLNVGFPVCPRCGKQQ